MAVDRNPDPDVVEIDLFAYPAMVELDGKSIEMLTYNGHFPGPLIQAKVGDEVVVHFENQTLEPTTIHWHGLRIPAEMDGNPRIQSPVRPGERFTYRFRVPEAGSFWYHPHVRANEQVERGLYGPFVVHDERDPVYDAERVFMVDDILLGADGIAPFLASHPEVMHGRNGNILLVNGEEELVRLEARPGSIERWRLVNTANARTMRVRIGGAASVRVIASDGGLLETPYAVPELVLPVGQRYDLEVRYGTDPVELTQIVRTVDDQGNLRYVDIDVVRASLSGEPRADRSIEWPVRDARAPRDAEREVTLRFDGVNGPNGIEWRINGAAHRREPLFTFRKGETVKLILINEAGPEHPFHLHGQWFERLRFGRLSDTEPGLKDTVLVPGFETVEVLAYFDNPGRWMAHCHILEHAELGMMSEIVVED